MMTYGLQEQYFTAARRQGVIFVRYTLDQMPVVEDQDPGFAVRVYDNALQGTIEIQADTLVLASGITPNDTQGLQEVFQVPADQDGFIQVAASGLPAAGNFSLRTGPGPGQYAGNRGFGQGRCPKGTSLPGQGTDHGGDNCG
jgi:heterodisulfide reductase subunit A-like polyferredoxin